MRTGLGLGVGAIRRFSLHLPKVVTIVYIPTSLSVPPISANVAEQAYLLLKDSIHRALHLFVKTMQT
jgi:hypothetical protein